MSAEVIALSQPKNRLTAAQRRILLEQAAAHRACAASTAEWLIRKAEAMERAVKLGQLVGSDRITVEVAFGRLRWERFQQL
jgi:hypothetical protein